MHFSAYISYQIVVFLFNFGKKKKNRTVPGFGCTEGATIHFTKSILELRICGLEQCHVSNGHAGDQFLDILLSFLFAFFSEPHSYRCYPTHTLPLGTAIAWVAQTFCRKWLITPFFAFSVCLAYLAFRHVSEPISFYLFALAHKIDPCLITSYETIKDLFSAILGDSLEAALSFASSYVSAHQ